MKKRSRIHWKHDAQLTNVEIHIAPLDALVGNLCIEFNNLEFVLSNLLQDLLFSDRTGLTAVWMSHMWLGRLRLMDTLLKARIPDPESACRDYFRRLSDFLTEIAGYRNATVHGMRMAHTQLDGKVNHFIVPNDFAMDPWVPRKQFKFDEAELREAILDIRLAVDRVGLLQQHLHGTPQAAEVLRTTEVRRRPPGGTAKPSG